MHSGYRAHASDSRTHGLTHHPVAGDPLYGPKRTLPGHGQFLHAAKLGFVHPVTGKLLTFTAPVPPIFEKTLTDLRAGIDKTRNVR